MKKIIKRISAMLAAAVVGLFAVAEPVQAYDLPYITYNYDYWEDIVYTPSAYVPYANVYGNAYTLDGESIGNFLAPQDLCKSMETGNVFIADTNNNRIVVLDKDMKNVVKIITSFDNNGVEDTFASPYGVAVSESEQLYIADSQNHRVVVLNPDDTLARIIENPESEVLEAGFVFTPLKVTVDYADRVYCIAQNMFEGIMVFETNGQFAGFFGTINVDISLWEKFWRKVSTKEERSKQQLFIPTEFTGIDIDPDGFVYASNIDADGKQGVRRLNPKGEDVIKKGPKTNVGGDLQIEGSTDFAGPSQFTDVVYRSNGIYSCLDKKRGRIFTYDHEGNLLYIFGGLGTQVGTFSLPVAIEEVGDKLVVLDSQTGGITTFEVTEYGRLINDAVALRFDGDEAEAVALWQRVLELDENNELANTGIGKSYLTAGNYPEAMKYLELGMSKTYYSTAFKRYRNNVLTENATITLTVVLIAILAIVFGPKIKNAIDNKKKREAEIAEYMEKKKSQKGGAAK